MNITREELVKKIDHTNLKPDITEQDIILLCRDAEKYGFASVCVPPYYVKLVYSLLKNTDVSVGTVIGFPNGYNSPLIKKKEAIEAVVRGAKELDIVMNISLFKSGYIGCVYNELYTVISSITSFSETITKVIIETCYLNRKEIINVCDIVAQLGAQYIKTSTGFGTRGATKEDVALLKETIDSSKNSLKIKAAGGIKTLDDALLMISNGAERLGTSSGVEIIKEFDEYMRNDTK